VVILPFQTVPLIYDHAQTPPEGWRFYDPAGVWVSGDTLRELEINVAQFRANNGLPPGNPAGELEAKYAKECPWLVSKVGAVPIAREDPVERWVARLWRDPVREREFVENTVTAERLGVCADCPHLGSDYSPSQEVRRRAAILSAGRPINHHSCSAHGWLVSLAALHPRPASPISVQTCWSVGLE
jgi:hypothetical protein